MGYASSATRRLVAVLCWSIAWVSWATSAGDEPWALDGEPFVKILHPASGQTVSASWQVSGGLHLHHVRQCDALAALRRALTSVWNVQGLMVASVGNFEVPTAGSIAVYVDDALAARLVEWPQTLHMPQLADGTHSIALSLQDSAMEVVAEDVVEVLYANSSTAPPLFWGEDWAPRAADDELTVIWTVRASWSRPVTRCNRRATRSNGPATRCAPRAHGPATRCNAL